jgi:Protein of unknown function (DUF3455)
MKLNTLQLALLLGLPLMANAQNGTVPDVPAEIKVPEGQTLVLQSHATGLQIYTCGTGADGQAQWTLKAPDAVLHDKKGAVIGHHFAGPSWKHKDGSEITGKATAKVNSPDSGSIPWLLVSVTGHTGSGVLAQVTTIQRINTKGGQPPSATGCDGAKSGAEAKSRYSADYLFYAPAK